MKGSFVGLGCRFAPVHVPINEHTTNVMHTTATVYDRIAKREKEKWTKWNDKKIIWTNDESKNSRVRHAILFSRPSIDPTPHKTQSIKMIEMFPMIWFRYANELRHINNYEIDISDDQFQCHRERKNFSIVNQIE